MFFLFPLAFFSLLVRNPPFGFPFLLNLLPLSDVLGRFGLQLFLLALGGSDASFLFLCSARSRLLVLLIAFFGLLLFAFARPTLGRLGNPIGLFGPLFAHHVSHRDLFTTGHCCLDTLLACHEHALFACAWSTHGLWWSSHPSCPLCFAAFALLLLCFFLPSDQHCHLHRHCAGQPLPFCPFGIGHLGLFPSPSSALVILVLVFNPEAHLVPGCIGLLFV